MIADTTQKTPERAPEAMRRADRDSHVLELLCIHRTRTTHQIGEFTGVHPKNLHTTLVKLEKACLIWKVEDGVPGFTPATWALREHRPKGIA